MIYDNEFLKYIAKKYGYENVWWLLVDYDIEISVFTPKHTKLEFVLLLLKELKNYKSTTIVY